MAIFHRFWRLWRPGPSWEPVTKPRVDVLSPKQFIRLYERSPNVVESVRVLPPRLGTDDFGRLAVKVRGTPVPLR